jgi:pimeloyl-ACP methyl ester carboxylesterase
VPSTTAVRVTIWGDGDPAVFVHGSLGSGTGTWKAQRPLADTYRLLLVDRRGFGESPGPEAGDFEVDARDLLEVMPPYAHLVGHSYGGVAVLLAAAHKPDLVRSLVVIEPPVLGLVRGQLDIEDFIVRIAEARNAATDADDYVRRFLTVFGLTPPSGRAEGDALRAATTSWRERPPWEAEIPLDVLRAAPFPKLVVRGGWDIAPQALGRAVFAAVCDVLVERLQAESATIPGVAHSIPRSGPPLNDLLRAFWEAA